MLFEFVKANSRFQESSQIFIYPEPKVEYDVKAQNLSDYGYSQWVKLENMEPYTD